MNQSTTFGARRFLLGVAALLLALACGRVLAATGAAGLSLWPVDPLIKVFPDAAPGPAVTAFAEVARGEHASFQIVARAGSDLRDLRVVVSELRGGSARGVLEPRPARFVGWVPVDRPTQKPATDQLRKPPADYPDPLLETESVDVPAGKAQAVWVTVPAPTNAAPGVYRGTLLVTASAGGGIVHARQRLELKVYPAVAGTSRLWVTDWYAMHWPHLQISPQPESEEYYRLLGRYARNLADHRHNVALISPLGLARFSAAASQRLQIDFSRFDRWVQVFQEAGVIGRIEGGHIGGRKAGWESDFVVNIHRLKDGQVVGETADPGSPEAETFYAQFFPALVAHLKEKGWLACYLQHLADEPTPGNTASYRAMAALARKHAPELRIVEACHTKDLAGAIDVWVPQLNFLHNDFAYYQARQQAHEEVWFYTCVFPQGEYANRFIELPLLKTRLLHWINFRYGITGYLHWGYNHWTAESPFTHTTRAHGGPPYLPAGDPWIVYPGKDGPLDSIRFEAMRDGIADYELLAQLAERRPEEAQRLARAHILDFDRYDTDVARFRATRRELLERLSAGVARR